MKLLKKPFFAVLICALVVFGSTLVSVNYKFGSQCREITNLFFDGMVHNCQQQDGIAKHLKTIYTACDSINSIAETHGLASDDFRYRSEDLRLSLTYSSEDASYIYHCYNELLGELKLMEKSLENAGIPLSDFEELQSELSKIQSAQTQIDLSGYNESVRQFLRDIPEFPTKYLAEIADIELPEYFG